MTALTLRDYEAAALWRDGSVVVRRPVKVPASNLDVVHTDVVEEVGGWFARRLYTVRGGALGVLRTRVACPLGSPGERRWVREPFSEHEDGAIAYAADGHDPHDVPTDRWQAPVTMPRWASRGDAVIASVEVEAEPWTWVVRVEVANG